MKLLKKLKSLILPEVIDFFSILLDQSEKIEKIVKGLALNYTTDGNINLVTLELIKKVKKNRKYNLKQLEKVFITPVDREAISRAHSHLYWIALSVEHLIQELDIYNIDKLIEYEKILNLLHEQMTILSAALRLFKDKKYEDILKNINHIVHLDNKLIEEYSKKLNQLFQKKDMEFVLKHREILLQLKEISKRIHFCANQIEDIVFKID